MAEARYQDLSAEDRRDALQVAAGMAAMSWVFAGTLTRRAGIGEAGENGADARG